MPKTSRPSSARVYYSQNDSCLRNGSFFVTSIHGPKGKPFAFYMNGDFIDFRSEVPPDRVKTYSCREAKKLLPACNR
jgi:hypothetical protein